MRTKKKAAAKKRAVKPKRDPHLPKVGTTITRKFKNKTYTLRATADGYKLGKTTYKSLTAAAKHTAVTRATVAQYITTKFQITARW